MNDVRIEGEPAELLREAFRGMQARRDTDGWVSITGRLDPGPGEALLRALRRVEAELPRRIGSTRDEHRAAALDEIARRLALRTAGVTRHPSSKPVRVERARSTADVASERFRHGTSARRLTLVPNRTGGPMPSRN